MATFEERENKVFNFMDLVQENLNTLRADDDFRNSTSYKLKLLDQSEKDAKEICLDQLFQKIYKDATPLSDDYKNACCDDMDTAFQQFMQQRCPKGIEYYVREGLKRKSPFAQKALEAVENLVDDVYRNKAMNIDDVKPDDLVFACDDDVQKKINIIGEDLGVPEIAQRVNANVRNTILSEIRRAKEKKNAEKEMEMSLANDINVNTPEALESAMEYHDMNKAKDYVPTLFEGILVNKMNKLRPAYESGELQNKFIYDALLPFSKRSVYKENGEPEYATLQDLAFIEAVEEYTAWSVLKCLKMESLNKYEIKDLAQEYASSI